MICAIRFYVPSELSSLIVHLTQAILMVMKDALVQQQTDISLAHVERTKFKVDAYSRLM